MEKGILTSVQEKQLATMLDDAIKLKGLWELVDGLFFKMLITFLDDTLLDKLKEEIKVKLAALVDAAMGNDVPLAEQLAADLMASLITIPGIDTNSEALLFKGAIELAVGAILGKLAKTKGTKVTLVLKKA